MTRMARMVRMTITMRVKVYKAGVWPEHAKTSTPDSEHVGRVLVQDCVSYLCC